MMGVRPLPRWSSERTSCSPFPGRVRASTGDAAGRGECREFDGLTWPRGDGATPPKWGQIRPSFSMPSVSPRRTTSTAWRTACAADARAVRSRSSHRRWRVACRPIGTLGTIATSTCDSAAGSSMPTRRTRRAAQGWSTTSTVTSLGIDALLRGCWRCGCCGWGCVGCGVRQRGRRVRRSR